MRPVPSFSAPAMPPPISGPLVAATVYVSWATSLYIALWRVDVAAHPFAAGLLVLWLQWLYCGLFITAHDACHHSAAPGRPRLNRAIGVICAASYAAFSFSLLATQHQQHHRHRGTARDPDFAGPRQADTRFWPWAGRFFGHYLRWTQIAGMVALSQVWLTACGLPLQNVLLFWALPSLCSALQLFYFGTYLPHRPRRGDAFIDSHRARNTYVSRPISLLSCYFFGYHHVHHAHPRLPWYALPRGLRHAAPR